MKILEFRGFRALPIILGILCLAINFPAISEIPSGTTLRTCDGGEWPSYIYFRRDNGEITDQSVSYDVDVFEKIFQKHGIGFTVELITWSRCLHEVETGETYKMVSSVTYSEERDQKYLMTDTYYTVQLHYFYPNANFPNGLDIQSLSDFSNYKVCGLRGYNYANFSILVETIEVGTKNFPQLIGKTERGHCDAVLGRSEIFAEFAQTRNDYIKIHNLGTASMPGVQGDKFFMMVSRNYENAEDLRQITNEGIADLNASGEAEKLISSYLN